MEEKKSAQADDKPELSKTVILVSKHANHRIVEKRRDENGKVIVVFDLKFRNGRYLLSREAFEDLKKIPAFAKRVGRGKNIGVLGDTKIVPHKTSVPEVRQDAGAKSQTTE